MKQILWVLCMPIVVLVFPWAGALVCQGRTQAVVLAVLWLVGVLVGAFAAIGPAFIGLIVLGVFQLARTPWRLPAVHG